MEGQQAFDEPATALERAESASDAHSRPDITPTDSSAGRPSAQGTGTLQTDEQEEQKQKRFAKTLRLTSEQLVCDSSRKRCRV